MDWMQIDLAIQLIKPVLDGKAKCFEITSEATDKYNEWLQGRLQNSVWTDCMSYYRMDRRLGKIIATFPGPVALFWWLCRKPRWERYKVVDGEEWEKERRRLRMRRVVMLLGIGICVVYRMMYM